MNILLLEDNRVLAETIKEALVEDGNECDVSYTGEGALENSYKKKFDFYLFDINVPGILGTTLLNELRKSGDMTPAIFITSKGDENSVLNGFMSGCDDYMRKPFTLSELKNRIRAIAKRVNGYSENIVKLGDDLVFDTVSYSLTHGEETQYLQKKAGQILTYFLKNNSRIVTKDELISEIWHDSIPSDAVIRVHISSIKKLIGNKYITTISGMGYKFDFL